MATLRRTVEPKVKSDYTRRPSPARGKWNITNHGHDIVSVTRDVLRR